MHPLQHKDDTARERDIAQLIGVTERPLRILQTNVCTEYDYVGKLRFQ